MVKRGFDIVAAGLGLIVCSPLLAALAVGIRVADGGPCLYRARRVGRHGTEFDMHKFRTMRVKQGASPGRLTSPDDARVYPFGAWLRRLKLDELPQLYDVLRGTMSIVGPRPEVPYYVREVYTRRDWLTLAVRPGLTSPASLYDYTHGDRLLGGGDVEALYLERLLPVRLQLEALYVEEARLAYDLEIIVRTLAVMVLTALGRREFPEPKELRRLREQQRDERSRQSVSSA